MPNLEISPHAAQRLRELSEKSEKSINELLLWLLDQHSQSFPTADIPPHRDTSTWVSEEVNEMIQPKKALTGKEMVEQGFIGGWEDLGIEDSMAWLEQQKARKRNKHQW